MRECCVDGDGAYGFYSLDLLRGEPHSPGLDYQALALQDMYSQIQVLRRQYGKAVTYAKGAISVLLDMEEANITTTASHGMSISELRNVFLDLETRLCRVGQPIPYLALNFQKAIQNMPPMKKNCPTVTPFHTVTDANDELQKLRQQIMLQSMRISSMTNGDKRFPIPLTQHTILQGNYNLEERFGVWHKYFKAMLADADAMAALTDNERRGLQLVEIHYASAIQVLEVLLDPSELCWDRFRVQHSNLVELTARFFEADDKVGRTPSSRRRLTLDYGLIPTMFYVGWKCRHARVRLAVIELLERYPRIESVWDSEVIADLCRRIDRIERGPGETLEQAAARDAPASEIPEEARVLYVGCLWSGVGRSFVARMMIPGKDPTLPFIPIDEELSW